ncbi:MAG: ATP-binding cassette domain-containing protein [Rubrobacter sp.]|nr:ATP-binding cassette domain-containing protein [Rubrobacter sp.]
MSYHLKADSLSKHFTLHMLEGRRLRALEDVSFAVEPGEFLGVVGRSGSGKSSLLRCLYRRYLPSSGSVLYTTESGPVDLAAADERTVLRLREGEIGYVSQFLRAIPRTLAREVVAEPLVRRGFSPEEAAERAAAILGSLGLPSSLQEAYPATMSGGEQQRVNLARALVSRPRFLLLDEPTSALDPETRALSLDAIRELNDAGTTMIGIFHDAESLSALADRVLVLEEGCVRWCGPAGEAAELAVGV